MEVVGEAAFFQSDARAHAFEFRQVKVDHGVLAPVGGLEP